MRATNMFHHLQDNPENKEDEKSEGGEVRGKKLGSILAPYQMISNKLTPFYMLSPHP
jgi:hypothetical protein